MSRLVPLNVTQPRLVNDQSQENRTLIYFLIAAISAYKRCRTIGERLGARHETRSETGKLGEASGLLNSFSTVISFHASSRGLAASVAIEMGPNSNSLYVATNTSSLPQLCADVSSWLTMLMSMWQRSIRGTTKTTDESHLSRRACRLVASIYRACWEHLRGRVVNGQCLQALQKLREGVNRIRTGPQSQARPNGDRSVVARDATRVYLYLTMIYTILVGPEDSHGSKQPTYCELLCLYHLGRELEPRSMEFLIAWQCQRAELDGCCVLDDLRILHRAVNCLISFASQASAKAQSFLVRPWDIIWIPSLCRQPLPRVILEESVLIRCAEEVIPKSARLPWTEVITMMTSCKRLSSHLVQPADEQSSTATATAAPHSLITLLQFLSRHPEVATVPVLGSSSPPCYGCVRAVEAANATFGSSFKVRAGSLEPEVTLPWVLPDIDAGRKLGYGHKLVSMLYDDLAVMISNHMRQRQWIPLAERQPGDVLSDHKKLSDSDPE